MNIFNHQFKTTHTCNDMREAEFPKHNKSFKNDLMTSGLVKNKVGTKVANQTVSVYSDRNDFSTI